MTAQRLRLLHTSDIHLDNRVGTEASPTAAEDGLSLVVERANEMAVDLLLLAGDLFDHNRVKDPCFEFVDATLSRLACPVVMITGNHDCMTDYSVYHRYHPEQIGDHVHFIRDEPGAKRSFDDLGLTIWGRGIVDHHPGHKPLEAVPDHDSDHWYVGMTHGYYVNRGAEMFSSLITPEEIADSGLHYLALGHVHVFNIMNHGDTVAAYSGSPNLEQGVKERSAAYVELCPENGVSVTQLLL